MKRRILCGLLIVALVCTSMLVGVFASDSIREITAQINYNLKMKVDNVEWNPTETDGSAIRPITYNGRTYLPVRALAEKLGVAIDWDAETQTVLIGEKEWTPIRSEMIKTHSDMGYTVDPDVLYNGNGFYNFGIFVSKQWISNQFSDVDITLGGSFSKMKLGVYATGGDKIVTITDKDTGAVLKQITARDGVATNVEFDINGTQKVNIKWGGNAANTLVFGDIYVK